MEKMKMEKELNTVQREILNLLGCMNEGERRKMMEIIKEYYCHYCGTDHKGRHRNCQCENDE